MASPESPTFSGPHGSTSGSIDGTEQPVAPDTRSSAHVTRPSHKPRRHGTFSTLIDGVRTFSRSHGDQRDGGGTQRSTTQNTTHPSHSESYSRSVTSSHTPVQDEVAYLRSKLRKKGEDYSHVKKRLALQQSQAAEELTRLNDALRAKDDVIASLKEQETKLRQAHPFLTSNDRVSANDVKELVEGLNYEILQVATATARYITEKVYEQGGKSVDGEKPEMVDRWSKLLGEKFCRELGAWNHKNDFTLLQVAFQATLCLSCRLFIDSWDNNIFPDLSSHLAKIYETMRETEPQSVFSQWRALTQRQLNEVLTQEHPEPRFIASIVQDITRLAIVAHVRHPELSNLFKSFLYERLQTLKIQVRSIKNAITLDFISGDLHLVSVHPGIVFDDRSMRDVFESGTKAKAVQVACTTELGLKMTRKVAKEDGIVGESLSLLMPQVFLESSLDEFLL